MDKVDTESLEKLMIAGDRMWELNKSKAKLLIRKICDEHSGPRNRRRLQTKSHEN